MARKELTPEEFAERNAKAQAKISQEEKPGSEGKAEKEEKSEEEKEYTPSDWTRNRIKEIPQNVKEEVKAIYGIDFDDMLEHPSDYGYGVMDFVASNNATYLPSTLKVDEKLVMAKTMADKAGITLQQAQQNLAWCPDLGKKEHRCNYRFWCLPGGKWGIELYEVNNLKVGGTFLTKEQAERVRLTGTIGEPIMRKNFSGTETPILAYLDKFSGQVIYRQAKDVEFQFKTKMENRDTFWFEHKEYRLDETAKKAAAAGSFVWATDVKDPTSKINVWFDPRTRVFRPTIELNPKMDLEEALRAKQKAKEEKKPAEAVKAGVGKTPAKGKAK